MKAVRQICAAVVLLGILALTTLAGEISCPAITTPPPEQTATGEVSCPGLQLAVSLFDSMLSLS